MVKSQTGKGNENRGESFITFKERKFGEGDNYPKKFRDENTWEDDETRDINDDSNSSGISSGTETIKKTAKVTGLSLYSRSKKIFAGWRFRSSSNRTAQVFGKRRSKQSISA